MGVTQLSSWESMAQALVAERYPRLLARAHMLVVSSAEAEDLVQDALVATFSRNRGFESLAQAEQYVRCAIVTQSINASRRGARERERMRGAAVPEAAPDHAGGVVAQLEAAQILRGLAPRVAACVALRYLEDLSIAETARLLSLSEGAVKRYVSDGLKELNSQLGTSAKVDDADSVPVRVREGGAS